MCSTSADGEQFQNAVFQSIEAVEDRLVDALADLESDSRRVAELTAFP